MPTPDKSISMSVNDVLELEYLVEEVSKNDVAIESDPTNELSEKYVSKDTFVFDPPKAETYQLNVNGTIIEITASKIPKEIDHHWNAEDDTDTTLSDQVGSLNGSINGASYVTGQVGDFALSFNGSSDYVGYNSTTVLPEDATQPFSYAH